MFCCIYWVHSYVICIFFAFFLHFTLHFAILQYVLLYILGSFLCDLHFFCILHYILQYLGDYPLKLLFFHIFHYIFSAFSFTLFLLFFYIALGGRFFHRFFFALFLLFQFHFWNLPKTGTTNHKATVRQDPLMFVMQSAWKSCAER